MRGFLGAEFRGGGSVEPPTQGVHSTSVRMTSEDQPCPIPCALVKVLGTIPLLPDLQQVTSPL